MSQPIEKETNKAQLSIRIPRDTNRKFQAKVKLAESDNTEIVGRLIEAYVSDDPGITAVAEGRKPPAAIHGQFVKCPPQFREFINTLIVRMMDLNQEELERLTKLMIRFSTPGEIQQILDEEAALTDKEVARTLRPHSVASKK